MGPGMQATTANWTTAVRHFLNILTVFFKVVLDLADCAEERRRQN